MTKVSLTLQCEDRVAPLLLAAYHVLQRSFKEPGTRDEFYEGGADLVSRETLFYSALQVMHLLHRWLEKTQSDLKYDFDTEGLNLDQLICRYIHLRPQWEDTEAHAFLVQAEREDRPGSNAYYSLDKPLGEAYATGALDGTERCLHALAKGLIKLPGVKKKHLQELHVLLYPHEHPKESRGENGEIPF